MIDLNFTLNFSGGRGHLCAACEAFLLCCWHTKEMYICFCGQVSECVPINIVDIYPNT